MIKTVKRGYDKNYMWFKVTLKSGKELIVEIRRLLPKDDNHYGNGTYTHVEVNGKPYKHFDTRYEMEFNTVEGYREFMGNWVEENWGANAKSIEQAF